MSALHSNHVRNVIQDFTKIETNALNADKTAYNVPQVKYALLASQDTIV
jgi:hypothetical protein